MIAIQSQRRLPRWVAILLVAVLLLMAVPAVAPPAAAAYTPPHSVIKVGIGTGQSSATLTNSSGFYFGKYSSGSKSFSSLSSTTETELTVTASGSDIMVKSGSTTVYTTSGSLAIAPKKVISAGTTYKPGSGTAYSYYGNIEFVASSGKMTAINYVYIEDYVKGILPYEMGASWHIEALKTQALCARTYAMYNIIRGRHTAYDLCNTTCCQVYRGIYAGSYKSNVDAAVDATAGQYILYDGAPINAVYHAASGGATENSENVWSSSLSYLKGVKDTYESTPSSYTFSGTYTAAEFYSKMKARDSGFNLADIAKISCVYTAMGNMYSITFTDSAGKTRTYSKEGCRTVYGAFATYASQRFTISTSGSTFSADGGVIMEEQIVPNTDDVILEGPVIDEVVPEDSSASAAIDKILPEDSAAADAIIPEDFATADTILPEASAATDAADSLAVDRTAAIEPAADTVYASSLNASTYAAIGKISISGKGAGHNVGMSQYGAKGMAESGYTCSQIIAHYYTGVTINGVAITAYKDVPAGSWFYEAVNYVTEAGLFAGTSSTAFSPGGSMTRGMFVTVFGRMAGVDVSKYYYTGTITGSSVNFRSGPGTSNSTLGTLSKGTTVSVIEKAQDSGGATWYKILHNSTTGYVHGSYLSVGGGSFSDVSLAYYTPYVQWAVSTGIISGYGNGKFGPDDKVTREQMCKLMYGYAGAAGITLRKDAVTQFADHASIADWAVAAVESMQAAGIVRGKENGIFDPQSTLTRAEAAQAVMNFHVGYYK